MATEETQQKDAQKTVVAFVIGLLVGGGLVWLFVGGGNDTAPTEATNETQSQTEALETDVDTNANGEEVSDESNENSSAAANNATETNPTATNANTVDGESSEGSVRVSDQAAGMTVALTSAVYPTDEGWVGVRDYDNGTLGNLLGVVRYSESQELMPQTITLQRATEAGEQYAVVFYTESGDREFSLADDRMISGVVEVFTAQ